MNILVYNCTRSKYFKPKKENQLFKLDKKCKNHNLFEQNQITIFNFTRLMQ